MATRVSTSPIVGFLPHEVTLLSRSFIRAVQTKQEHTFKLADALMNADFLRAFVQECRELLKRGKSDDNLLTVLVGIALIKELRPAETYELTALQIGCWMVLYQEDKAYQMISGLDPNGKDRLNRAISEIVQDATDPLYNDYLQIQRILQVSF